MQLTYFFTTVRNVIDEIDFQALIVHPHLEMEIADTDGAVRSVTVAKSRWESLGVVLDETVIMKGLLELESIRNIWMQHTRDAVNGEALEDYYHSMFPEAASMSFRPFCPFHQIAFC